MSIGNMVIVSGCEKDENGGLKIPTEKYSFSEGVFNPGSDGSYTISLAVNINNCNTTSFLIASGKNSSARDYGDLFCLYFYNKQLSVAVNLGDSRSDSTTLYDFFLTNGPENIVIDLVYTIYHVYVYKNGKLFKDYSVDGKVATPTNRLGLCCLTNEGGMQEYRYGSEITYYAFNLYDRALTPEEIEHNFNTYNNRYNLNLK